MKSIRVYFLQSYQHVMTGGAKLVYRAGEFYHVAEEHALEFVAAGVAKTEQAIEEEAAAAAAAAAVDKAKADESPVADLSAE